jgi:lysophospholipase L1-like esterase
LSKDITESSQKICDHYGVKWILLHDIDKQSGHPSQKGMKAIAEQIAEKLKN